MGGRMDVAAIRAMKLPDLPPLQDMDILHLTILGQLAKQREALDILLNDLSKVTEFFSTTEADVGLFDLVLEIDTVVKRASEILG